MLRICVLTVVTATAAALLPASRPAPQAPSEGHLAPERAAGRQS